MRVSMARRRLRRLWGRRLPFPFSAIPGVGVLRELVAQPSVVGLEPVDELARLAELLPQHVGVLVLQPLGELQEGARLARKVVRWCGIRRHQRPSLTRSEGSLRGESVAWREWARRTLVLRGPQL